MFVLVGYRSNDNKLRVWERVEGMFCYSYCNSSLEATKWNIPVF